MDSILFLLCLLPNIFELHVSAQKIHFSVPKEYTDHIFIYYFKGPTIENRVILKLEDGLSLTDQKEFDVNSTTIFFYHGWGDGATGKSTKTISSAFLEKKTHNMVAFDYSKLVVADYNPTNYVISVVNATFIGQALGEFFKLYIPNKQPNDHVKMVSHSLGSQIMAKTARAFGSGKLTRLTGLDPAGPLFNIPGIEHLDAKDGKFVDVIHTDGNFYGDSRTIGMVDFFPNNGTRYQPGCESDLDDVLSACSHLKSYEFYAESILNPQAFLAKKCERNLIFNYCCCNTSDVTYMGYYVDTNVKGTYFLKTNAAEPYGQGAQGIS